MIYELQRFRKMKTTYGKPRKPCHYSDENGSDYDLMFMGPCIVLYFYSKNQLDAQFFEFVEYHSTCFGPSFRPSSEVQDCT